MIFIKYSAVLLLVSLVLSAGAFRAQAQQESLSTDEVSIVRSIIGQVSANKSMGDRLGVALFRTTNDLINLPESDPRRLDFLLWLAKVGPKFDGNKSFTLELSRDLYGTAPRYVVAKRILKTNIFGGLEAKQYAFSSGAGKIYLVVYFTEAGSEIPIVTPLAGFESVVEVVASGGSGNWTSVTTISEEKLSEFITMLELGLGKLHGSVAEGI